MATRKTTSSETVDRSCIFQSNGDQRPIGPSGCHNSPAAVRARRHRTTSGTTSDDSDNGREVTPVVQRRLAIDLLGKLVRKLGDLGVRTQAVKDAEAVLLEAIKRS